MDKQQQKMEYQDKSHREQDLKKASEDCIDGNYEKSPDTIEIGNTNDNQEFEDFEENDMSSNRTQRLGKLFIFLLIVACLVIGKNITFLSNMNCVNDKILNTLKFANDL